MEFLEKKNKDRMLFPRPIDGAIVNITPPGLAWLPAEGSSGYRVEIRNKANGLIYEKSIGSDPVHLPDQIFPSGEYEWDVIALDDNANDSARRGLQTFIIPDKAPELPWIDPEELLSKVPEGHSRLLYPASKLPEIRQTLETTRKQGWEARLKAAEKSLDMPAPEYPNYHLIDNPKRCRLEYSKYFGDFRRYINGALMNLSLAYLMTEEDKYAEAAKRILLEVTRWPTDDQDVTSVRAKWGDEPGLSMSRCAHRAYDWLYHALTDEERSQVLKMCEERAWQTYRRLKGMDYLTNPGSSHDGRLIAYLSEMAIVMARESKGAKTWLDYSLKALTTFYPHWGGYEGGWAEGVPYGLWYNEFYIPAFEGLRMTTGFDLWKRPFFNNVRYFFFYCTAIRGEIRPFGDGAERGGPGISGGSGYASLLWYHAHRFNDPYIGWWVDQIQGWNRDYGELTLLFDDKAASTPPEDLPDSRVFRGVGWAGLHGDMCNPDEDTFLLFKSSPYGSVSHSHADQNSFCIMKGGKALAIASGYYGPTYGMPHHAEWTRSTKANNCVLVNGEGQAIRKAKANGKIMTFEERAGLTYVSGDATPAYMGKLEQFHRHILFLRPNLFLLLDDLKAPEPSYFQWMLHAFDRMELDEKRNSIRSMRENTTLDVYLKSPAGIGLSQTDEFDTPYNAGIPKDYHRNMSKQWHVTAETRTKLRDTRIAGIMYTSMNKDKFNLELLEMKGWFGARVTSNCGQVEGWIQIIPGIPGPDNYDSSVAEGKSILCGKAVDGETFVF
ncbi:DUF4962 domain-containing protein [Candidatus Poribacteria bacterium]|nr:DUF4962 domain-containing protein [Candidatus Poribacteria bacterium]